MSENIFNSIISKEEFFIGMPDCISCPEDYYQYIEESINITNSILQLDNLSSLTENGKFLFKFSVNQIPNHIQVDIISDYVDSKNFINGLNKMLKNVGYSGNKKYYCLYGSVLDFGVAFTTEDKIVELVKENLIVGHEEFHINNNTKKPILSPEELKNDEEMAQRIDKMIDDFMVNYSKGQKYWWQFWK